MTQNTRRFFNRKLFLGKPLAVNKHITLYTPKVYQILEFGEERYFNTVFNMIGIPTSDVMYKFLSDNDSNFEIGYREKHELDFFYFSSIIRELIPEDTKLIFGDLDLSKFELAQKNNTKEYVLFDEDSEAVLDRVAYSIIMDYLCQMHGIERDEISTKYKFESFCETQEQYQSVLLPLAKEYPSYMGLSIFAAFQLLKDGILKD